MKTVSLLFVLVALYATGLTDIKLPRWPPPWNDPFWSNWGLVFIGVFTAVAAFITLRKISKQTRASIEAAKAAKTSADAQMSGDRAWLLLENIVFDFPVFHILGEPFKPEACKVSYKLKNWGKTPAFVQGINIRFELSDSSTSPPHPETYGIEKFDVNPHIIPQTDSRDDSRSLLLTNRQSLEFLSNLKFLWFYGIAKYADVYGNPCETRFCFRSEVLKGAPGAKLRLDGDKEYNKAT